MPSFTKHFSLESEVFELPHGSNPPVLGGSNAIVSNQTETSFIVTFTCPRDDMNATPPYQIRPPAVPLTYQISYKRECDFTWTFTPTFVSQEFFPQVLVSGLAPATQYLVRVHHSGATPSLMFRGATVNTGTNSLDGTCCYYPTGVNHYGSPTLPTQSLTVNGHVWQLESDASFPYVISVDGIAERSTSNEAIALIYDAGSVCYMDKSHRWWRRPTPADPWTFTPDPRRGSRDVPTLPALTGFEYAAAYCKFALAPLDGLKIYVIYRGSAWNNGTAGLSLALAQQKLLDTFNSAAFQNLSEYYIYNRPTVISQQVDASVEPPAVLDGEEHRAYLLNAIKTGVVPYRTEIETLYLMIYPIQTTSTEFGSGTNYMMVNDGVVYNTFLLLHPAGVDSSPPHEPLEPIDWYTGDLVHEVMDLITDPGVAGEYGWQGLAGLQNQLGAMTLSNIQHIQSPGAFVGGVWFWGYFSNLARKFIIPA